MSWSLFADILGVVAFLVVVLRGLYYRLAWALQPAYVLSRIEEVGGQLEAWLMFNNGGPVHRSAYSLALTVSSAGTSSWKDALFVPNYAEDALTVIPPGTFIKRVRLRLVVLDGVGAEPGGHDGNGMPIPSPAWLQREASVIHDLFSRKCPLKAEMSTSEGTIALQGKSGIGQPIAKEIVPLRKRIARLL